MKSRLALRYFLLLGLLFLGAFKAVAFDKKVAPADPGTLVKRDRQCLEQVDVPGGYVTLGSDKAEKAYAYAIGSAGARRYRWFDHEQRRRVNVRQFSIDKYLVTQARYLEFVSATGHRYPFISERDYIKQGFLVHPYGSVKPYLWHVSDAGYRPPQAKLDDPVVLVDASDAMDYCAWRSTLHTDRSFRLPYEDEWEKAARGTHSAYFPWGNRWDSTRANVWTKGQLGTTPVDRYPSGVSPYGVYDMAGNVFEWTLTRATPGSGRMILKSCSYDDMPGICRGAARHARLAQSRHILIGFRCVSTAN